jgi:hypothetical protein
MRHALTGLLFAGATCALVFATPAFADLEGDPGSFYAPNGYANEAASRTYDGSGSIWGSGPLGPLGIVTAPITGPLSMLTGNVPIRDDCGIYKDFNGRMTALCGL